MLKRILSFILSLALLLSLVPAQALATEIPEEEIPVTEETAAEETLPEETAAEATLPEETVTEETLPEETEALSTETAAEEPVPASVGINGADYLRQVYDEPYADIEEDVLLEEDFHWEADRWFELSKGVTLTVADGATLTLDYHSTIRGTLLVESGATLVIREAASLYNGGVLRVEKGGTLELCGTYLDCDSLSALDVRGSFAATADAEGNLGYVKNNFRNGTWGDVTGIPEDMLELGGLIATEAELREVLAVQSGSRYKYFSVSLVKSFSLTEDLTVRDNTISGHCVLRVTDDAVITVSRGVTLASDGTLSANNGTLQNEGTVVSDSWISVNDSFVNNGTVELRSGRISVGNTGAFHNNGEVLVGSNTRVDITGTWNGAEPMYMVRNEYYLQELLTGADKNPVMGIDVVLNNDFTIHGDINKLNLNATLTVPAGITLTIDTTTVFVNWNGAIVVEKGGTLIVNASVSCWAGGRVENHGTMKCTGNWGYVIANYENGQVVNEIIGVPGDLLWLRFIINNDADLQNAVKVMKEGTYVRYILLVHGDIVLSENVTIPKNAELMISDMPSTTTIPAGKKLINNGSLRLEGNQVLENYGIVENNGNCIINGRVFNNGTFRSNGSLYLYGSWEGNSVEYPPVSQADVEKAMKENGGYYLNREFTLERDLKVKGWLEVGTGGRLVVPQGKKLILEADSTVIVGPYGTLEVYGSYQCKVNADGWKSAICLNTENNQLGTVIGVAESDLRYNGYVYQAANFPMVVQMVNAHPNADRTFIYLHTDMELSENVVLPVNCIFHLNNGTLTVSEGGSLKNYSEFYCWHGMTVRNQGTIDNRGFIAIMGTLDNQGQIDLNSGSYLVLDGSGYAGNSGSVDAYGMDSYDILGTWEGNPVNNHWITQDEFEQMLAAGGSLTLDKPMQLERDLVIPDSVQLNVSGGHITVPEDVKLTLKGSVTLYEGGITVSKGGVLDLMGMIFMHRNGALRVEGTFRSEAGDGDNVALFYANGMTPCTVTGVPREKQRLYVQLWEQEQYWLGGLEAFEANGYSKVFLEILSDVTLPRDLTIPENGYLLIEGYAQKLTVPEGVTLTNCGVLRIDEAKSIFNYGRIENKGYFYVRANLFNHGTLALLSGGTMELPKWGYVENLGEVTVSGGSRLIMAQDSMWVGSEPVWSFITQERLEAELAAAAESGQVYTLHTDVTLERDLTLTSRLIIGSGGNLVVPKGVKLTLRSELDVVAGGRLEVAGSYILAEGGQLASRYENGHLSSQLLGIDKADLLVRMPVLSQEDLLRSVTALEAEAYATAAIQLFESVTLTQDLTIPQNALVHLESDSNLTVSQGCTLTNLGHIYVWDGNSLENNGTVFNHNQLILDGGSLVNNGTVEVFPGKQNWEALLYVGQTASVWSMGRIALRKDGVLEMRGTWNGVWPPEIDGGYVLPQAQSLTVEGQTHFQVDLRQNQGFTVRLQMPGAVVQQLMWTTDDCNGQVLDLCGIRNMGNGEYYVPLVGAGKATLTAKTQDGSNLSATVTVEAEWADWSPRLGSTTIAVNPMLAVGGQTSLVPSFGNRILSCRFEDSRFTAEYDEENAALLVNTPEEMKNTTLSTRLLVTCADGETYDYSVKLTVKNAAPGVTVKQTGKVDLFYTDSQAELKVTAKNAVVTALELADTEDFCLEEGKLRLTDSFVRDCRNYPKLKPDTKATLRIYLEGYRFPVTKAITIGTTTGKMNLTAVPASGTVHSTLGGDLTAEFQVMNKAAKTPLDLDARHISAVEDAFVDTWQVEEGSLALTLSGSTGGTANVWVRLDNWMQAVKVSCKITVNDNLPTVKAAVSTLKLSSTFPGQEARTALNLSHGNLEIDHFENDNVFLSTAKEDSSAWKEAQKLQVIYDGTKLVAKIRDGNQIPKAGTYSFSAVPVVGGMALNAVTVKVKVEATLPKVKLSTGTVKLNTLLSGEEVAAVKATMTNTTGYKLRLVGFQILEPFSDYVQIAMDEDILSVRLLNRRTAKYPHTLIPIVEDDRGTQVSLPALKLTVQAYEKEVSVTQSAKGSLDAIARENGVVYTITKLTNALGSVENVELIQGSEWFTLSDLSLDAKGKQVFSLKLKEDAAVSVKESYPVQFKYTVCGREILSKVLKLKVKESSLKVSVPKVTYYKSQQLPLAVSLNVTAPVGARIGEVSVNAKTGKELLAAIGAVSFSGDVLGLEIANPGSLVPGRTYKLVLDLIPQGHAADAKLPQLTVNVKIAK